MRYKKKKWIAVTLSILLCALGMMSVQAQPEQRQGSLTICYEGTQEEKVVPLEKMEVFLYYIGTSMKDGTVAEEFKGVEDLRLDNMEDMAASELKELAVSTAKYAKEKQVSYISDVTDAKGYAHFTELDHGVYLVVSQAEYKYENGVFLNVPFFISVLSKEETETAAKPKTEWLENLTVGLADLVEYTGGNEMSDDDSDGFAKPRYTGIPKGAQWKIDDEVWEEDGYPFSDYYTRAADAYGDVDSNQTVENDKEPGIYISHIKPVKEDAVILCSTDGFETERRVVFTTGKRVVRNINENKNENQWSEIVSAASADNEGLTKRQIQDLKNGIGTVVIPKEAVLTVNGKEELGTEEISNTGLLFDQLLYSGTKEAEKGAVVLEKRAENELKESGAVMKNRKFQSRYLDLVDYQDGNLWLSSDLGSDVYWPYPKGTNRNTKFDLYHFQGLHREYEILGNGKLEEMVQTAPVEKVKIENTEYGIRFHIPESGFSPFVLSWTSGESQNPPTDTPDANKPTQNIIDTVKTGDVTPIAALIILLVVSGIGIVYLVYIREKKM